MTKRRAEVAKRPYELGKRLEQMDRSRAAILRAAEALLAAEGYRQLTMGSIAAASGLTRQTVHNLFGTRAGVLEALFDAIAREGGMERMREAMTASSAERMLELFVARFCGFWRTNRMLLRRIHGIGAIDPEFGAVIEARNRRRLAAAMRVTRRMSGAEAAERAALLAALTSFEFFDAVAESLRDESAAQGAVLRLAQEMFLFQAARTAAP